MAGGGESDISFIDDDQDVMALIVDSRLQLADQLLNEGQYGDAAVAYKAALAMAPGSEAATRGLEQSQRGLAMNDLDLPADASSSGEPQVLTHLLRSHLEESEAVGTPAAEPDGMMDVVFDMPGSIGILFEAASEYAAITVGEVKPASQASQRSELVRGLVLLKVQGESIEGLKFERALELLSNKERPLTLTFSCEPLPSPPASPSPSVPALDLQTPTADTPNPSMRTTRETETPYTRVQRDWDDAVRAFNENSKKGVKYMVEVGLVKNTPMEIARMLADEDGRGLSKHEIGEYLSGGKPDEQEFRLAVRSAYLERADFTGWSFVAALRSFLRGFRLPGESMLIERIMSSFAVRFYEQNPGYCVHLTDEKIGGLQDMFAETSGGESSIGIHLVNSLFKSLRSDFNYMKDAEIYDMMEVTPNELAHTRELLEIDALSGEELNRTTETLRRATALMKLETEAQVARSQADAAAVAAEQTAVLAAEAHDDERMQLGRDAGDRGLEAEYAETIATAAEQAAATAAEEFENLSPGFRVELPMFLAMVARKLGTDTMFVLSYSIIMLNTDAHNPRLSGSERMSKAQFIESNNRTPDLAAISEVIMASLYDEIVSKEIKLKDDDTEDGTGDDSTTESDSVAGGLSPVGYLRRMSTVIGGAGAEEQTPPKAAFDPADVGQRLYAVQQTGLKGVPRKVKVGLTGMGISVFDAKGRPLTNLLYQTMVKWGVDRSLSDKVLGLRVLTDEASGGLEIFFKTPEGEDLCAVLSAHSLAMKKAERLREKAEAEKLRASQRELDRVTQALDDMAAAESPPPPPPPAAEPAPAPAPAPPLPPAEVQVVAAAPAAPPLSSLALQSGVHSEMDSSLRAATLSVQEAYVRVAASAAGVDGAEVPRSGREAYIALYRIYNGPLLPDVAAAVAAQPEPVAQIPLPPIDATPPTLPEPPAPAAVEKSIEYAEEQVEAAVEKEGLAEEDDGASDNGTATSETDSDDAEEDGAELVPAAATPDAAAVEMNGLEADGAVGPGGEPALSRYYGAGVPMVPMETYYAKSPSAGASEPAGSPGATAMESEFGLDVRRRVQLTRAFTQLRDELGDEGASEVVAEVYDEVSPPRFADAPKAAELPPVERPVETKLTTTTTEEQMVEEQKRTLLTPDKPPYEASEDGKEVLF